MSKTNIISRGGVFTALSLLFIYLSSILPTNKLALLTLSTFLIISSIITIGVKGSFMVYAAVSILSIFLVNSKGIAFIYILFFGLYGFVKFYIEKIRKLPLEIFIKILFFNSIFALTYSLYEKLFIGVIDLSSLKFSVYILIIALEIGFIIYDYVLTLFVTYFNSNLINKFFK